MKSNLQLNVRAWPRLRSALLKWYDGNRRDLPWRRTRDPYAIWISEIMLQQTRVAAVLQKYAQFLARFPNVQALSRASLEEVLALWSGLGYYRRARALHQAARRIAASHVPKNAEEWRALPGIGRYTANAIASIAYGERCAVVDGNVERVVRRVTESSDAPTGEVWLRAEEWLSAARPGDFNQAMMELGAMVCLPAAPKCSACPLHTWCATRGALPGRPAEGRHKKNASYLLAVRRGAVYLRQRSASERLMPRMWELPEITANGDAPLFSVRHSITVTDFKIDVIAGGKVPRGGKWVVAHEIADLALTGLARKILRKAEVI